MRDHQYYCVSLVWLSVRFATQLRVVCISPHPFFIITGKSLTVHCVFFPTGIVFTVIVYLLVFEIFEHFLVVD